MITGSGSSRKSTLGGKHNLSCGQIVSSKSGRDYGRLFVIIDIVDDEYVLLADGELRKVEKPKRKNIKHIAPHKTILSHIAEKLGKMEKIENPELRRAIEPLEIEWFQQQDSINIQEES